MEKQFQFPLATADCCPSCHQNIRTESERREWKELHRDLGYSRWARLAVSCNVPVLFYHTLISPRDFYFTPCHLGLNELIFPWLLPGFRFLLKFIQGGVFQPCASNSCRHSVSAAGAWCSRPLSSSTGAIWGLSGFLKGTTVVFVEGAESVAHSFSTPRHPRDYLSWNLTSQVQVRRIILCDICDYTSPTRAVCVRQCTKVCMCVCVCVCTDVSQLPLFSHSHLTVCLVCPTSSCCIMEVGDSHIWSQEMKDIIYKKVSALPLCVFLTHTHTHTHTHPLSRTLTHKHSNRPQLLI